MSKPHMFLIANVRFGFVNVCGQIHVDENTDAANSTVAFSEEQFFSGVIDGVERLGSSRFGQADDVVPYPSCLHDKSFVEDSDASVRAL
ncbi:unnamed protein product [Angiostrongylus costaricensis]|uniref:Uncharacterized protein n=1 Tax=Angiostrongylus costaricensis TaxID=334426 RepID=A0A0R3PK62_ANGCS|nr:unnamed protein product [Angiostrongylus costaricensis]